MSYVRPSAEDIDSWSNQAEGWSWKALEPYFRKCESLLPATVTNSGPEYFPRESRLHGDAGPVQLSWPASTSNIDQYVVKAMSNLSVPCLNKDPYGGHHLGFAQYFSTIDRRGGQVSRSYAATGYLRPCLDRPNLRILTEAFACQILLDTPGFRARGVKFVYKGHEHRVFAKREVILSASTIQSPRLLELSGIGNPEVLEAAGVPCLVALPEVGENLQEHPLSVVTYELTESPEHVTLDSLFTNPDVLQVHLKRLQENQDGLLSGVWGLIGFLHTHHMSQKHVWSPP
jgi:choline dehydrogenase-like flavoprotein